MDNDNLFLQAQCYILFCTVSNLKKLLYHDPLPTFMKLYVTSSTMECLLYSIDSWLAVVGLLNTFDELNLKCKIARIGILKGVKMAHCGLKCLNPVI